MKLSVVTVALNSAATIADTMQSVAVQDWPDFEHIVVDGGSSDGTMAIVDRFASPRLSARSEPDRGFYDAMNKGLARATGDAVGFLNSDDFFCRPDALRLIANAFARGQDCVGGRTVLIDRHDPLRVTRVYPTKGFAPWMLRFGHMPNHPTFYARRSLLNEVGGFDTSYRIAGDFDLIVRLLWGARAKIAVVPQTLVAFREGGVSTKNFGAKVTMNREIARVLRAHAVMSHQALLWGRYPFKLAQKLGRVADYPDYLAGMGLPVAR